MQNNADSNCLTTENYKKRLITSEYNFVKVEILHKSLLLRMENNNMQTNDERHLFLL